MKIKYIRFIRGGRAKKYTQNYVSYVWFQSYIHIHVCIIAVCCSISFISRASMFYNNNHNHNNKYSCGISSFTFGSANLRQPYGKDVMRYELCDANMQEIFVNALFSLCTNTLYAWNLYG